MLREDPSGTFVWQDLSAPYFAAAALKGFNPKKITRAQREDYYIETADRENFFTREGPFLTFARARSAATLFVPFAYDGEVFPLSSDVTIDIIMLRL